MIFLFTAILFSTMIAMVLKYSELNKLNRYAVTTVNYVVAVIIGFITLIKDGVLFPEDGLFLCNFGTEFTEIVINNNGMFSPSASLIWALLVGVYGGIFYFLGFIFIQKSINTNGVGITGAVSKLSIIFPVLIALFLWNEVPNNYQVIGIVISFLSIIMVNLSFKDINLLKNFNTTILLLFLVTGCGETSNKLFQNYAIAEYKSLYLLTIFFTALLISIYMTVKSFREGKLISLKDVVTGVFVGIPNFLTSYFLILSFKTVKATVAFPVYSAGSILLINLGGFFFFREQVSLKNKISILVIIIAIVLMNVK